GKKFDVKCRNKFYTSEYDEKSGVGTVISLMLPYTIAMLIMWIVMAIIWIYFRIPLGPGANIGL
ncbi:AbgT family transporter, partial [Cetobacterium sp.]|uniref:AbgT family transporter n=1 Tax=Cetobacterium sp. TaxID=2071632 RepID=UPI002FCCAD9A